jgi:PAS domain-containing protein
VMVQASVRRQATRSHNPYRGKPVVQQPVELILLKQVAGYLATPMFLVDPAGTLLFYNEPAEELLGHRYEETGQMPLEEWGTIFSPTDSLGRPLPPEDLPLAQALLKRTPTQGSFFIRGLDGVSRHLSVTAVPLEGPGGTDLGALAIFWALPRR